MDLDLDSDSLPPHYRAKAYFIARLTVRCERCGAPTCAAALGLPASHEVCDGDAGWESVAANALLFHVVKVSSAAAVQVRRIAPGYRELPAEPARDAHWSNHCEHCGASIDDQELHCEPGETFVPISEAQGSKICISEMQGPFEAWAAGCSLESAFVPFPRRW
jgi:hypothetical protein